MQRWTSVGLLIVRVETTGGGGAALRARVTWLTRLDDPESERTTHVATRAELHALLDRWLDAVGRQLDPGGDDLPGRSPRAP